MFTTIYFGQCNIIILLLLGTACTPLPITSYRLLIMPELLTFHTKFKGFFEEHLIIKKND